MFPNPLIYPYLCELQVNTEYYALSYKHNLHFHRISFQRFENVYSKFKKPELLRIVFPWFFIQNIPKAGSDILNLT